MKKHDLDPALVAAHQALFKTQFQLQSRLLNFLEQVDALDIIHDAWDEFNFYENVPFDPEDAQSALHFFPWALFYWRREIPERELEAAREQLAQGGADLPKAIDDEDDEDDWLAEIEAMSDEQIDEILADTLDDELDDDWDDRLDGEFDEAEDEPQVVLPPIATMILNSVRGADGPDSEAMDLALSDQACQLIEAGAQAPYSFFKVVHRGPASFVTLQDMIVPNEVQAYAPVLFDTLEKGDVIYGQVLTVDDMHLLSGVAPLVLPPIVHEAVHQASQQIEQMVPSMAEEWRYDLEFEMRSLYQSLVAQIEELGGGQGGRGGDDGDEDDDGDSAEPIKIH